MLPFYQTYQKTCPQQKHINFQKFANSSWQLENIKALCKKPRASVNTSKMLEQSFIDKKRVFHFSIFKRVEKYLTQFFNASIGPNQPRTNRSTNGIRFLIIIKKICNPVKIYLFIVLFLRIVKRLAKFEEILFLCKLISFISVHEPRVSSLTAI